MTAPNTTAASLPVAADPVAAQGAQMRARTVKQLQELSAKVAQVQAYLAPDDIARLTQAVTQAGATGVLDPTALVSALGHAESRMRNAPQAFMDAFESASDVFDAVAAQAARGDAQALTREQQLSAAIRNAIELLSSSPAGATAQMQQLAAQRPV